MTQWPLLSRARPDRGIPPATERRKPPDGGHQRSARAVEEITGAAHRTARPRHHRPADRRVPAGRRGTGQRPARTRRRRPLVGRARQRRPPRRRRPRAWRPGDARRRREPPDGRGGNHNARLFRAAARLPVQQHTGSTAVRVAPPSRWPTRTSSSVGCTASRPWPAPTSIRCCATSAAGCSSSPAYRPTSPSPTPSSTRSTSATRPSYRPTPSRGCPPITPPPWSATRSPWSPPSPPRTPFWATGSDRAVGERGRSGYASLIESPSTVISRAGSGRVAGPPVGLPVAASNVELWQGHVIVPPETSLTAQP